MQKHPIVRTQSKARSKSSETLNEKFEGVFMDTRIMDMTNELAQDYVCFKLGKGKPVNSISQSAKTMRRIGCEAEATHGDLFTNMMRTISCDSDDISEAYVKIVETMFADNIINWGRIAILFTFSGHLALYCERHGSGEEANSVVPMLTDFVRRRLLKWIQNNGGWVS